MFHSINMTYDVNLTKQGLPLILVNLLPRSLFNTLMELSYSAFVSKFFISKYSPILHCVWFFYFASVFGCSQFNRLWQSLECSVVLDVFHFLVMLSFWYSVDRVSTLFSVSPMYLHHSHNLICKHRGNLLTIVYFVVA